MTPDWDAIEIDYRAGILSNEQICEKHKITLGQLKSAASSRGWTQNVIRPEDQATIHAIAHRTQTHPRFPCDSLFDADEVKKVALMTASQIISEHRVDIAKLRGLNKEILTRVSQYLLDGDTAHVMPLLGKNGSVTDLIEQASRIMTRQIALEREAYGIEGMVITNDGDEAPMAKEIRELNNRLKNLTEQKAQRKEVKTEEKIKVEVGNAV